MIPVPVDPFLWDRRLEELLSVPARRGHRIPVRLRDWSRFVSDADEDDGAVVNIGARGVLLETARQLELGTKVGLSFSLPGDPAPVAVVGQVVRLAGEEDGLARVGVEFLVYRGDARERIAAFVDAEPKPERPGAPTLALTVRSFGETREWEEELRASEIRKALILDSALDCILTADHEGRIIEFNAASRRLFGYSRSEVLGREVADTIVPPALRDDMRRRLREFVVTGDSADLGRRREATAMRSDGSLIPVEVVVVPAYVKGRVILSAYIRDLSERRRSERLSVARQRATQALTASLSLVEASPAVLDALVHGLQCSEARLWVLEGDPKALVLAGTSSGAPHSFAPGTSADALARHCLEEGVAVWEGPPASGTGVELAVPVRAGGSVLGVIEVRCERARERELDWVTALADVASLLALFLKRQHAEADLQRFARYDSLTGLPNRSFFLDTLERTLSRAGRQRTRSALVFLDLDGFKAVNDGLGHAAGDIVLQTMAERLRAGTRSSDLVARIGGDEFTVLVQNLARADDAALVARGLLDRLAKPCRTDNHDVTLSASAGISVYPEDGTDADTLLRNADLAMYRAKQEGKNTYRFFTAEMSERALERMLLLDSLRSALERDEFEIVYLPVLYKDQAPSLEALLRWRHPKLGLVAPASFIAQAEESGLMLPIGAGVLRGATRFAASLEQRDVRVVVNLSARQFLQPNLVESVRKALEASSLEASQARARPHRGVGDDGGRGGHRAPAPAAPPGRAARARRLRHRLLLDPQDPRPRLPPPQDRPLAGERAAPGSRPGRAGRGDPGARQEPGARRGGRRRRDRGAASLPGVEGLHGPAGLPAEPSARRRGRSGLPGQAAILEVAPQPVARAAGSGCGIQPAACATIRSSSGLALSIETKSASCARARSRLWPGRAIR